ncbi:hypothetical protein A3Q56_08074 [Intoshia linei]|uniref:Transposase Helix-turn-helix domain-containing protein n=1 Tax=Intoshia linei TaxID=1819745 RepID=A0A177AQD3_9BILA|nr:hypothetical protein A3Q56_08074 [Intoshia linei]
MLRKNAINNENRINSIEEVEYDDVYNEGRAVMKGKVYDIIKYEDMFKEAVNFTELEIQIIFTGLKGSALLYKRRGPKRKVNDLDSLLLLLYWMKNGLKYKVIALTFRMKYVATVQKAIEYMLQPLRLSKISGG